MLNVLVALLVTAPFTDVLNRFTAELPPGFRFAPMPGDIDGVAFQVKTEGVTGNVAVRIFAVGPGVTTAMLADQITGQLSAEPGFRELTKTACSLGCQAASCRRGVHDFSARGDKYTKMFEDALVVAAGTAYVVHVESLAEVFGSFEADFVAFRNSLQFAGLRAQDAVASLIESPVIGRWTMVGDAKTELDLRADGTFSLAGTAGTFHVGGTNLVMQGSGSPEESFVWELTKTELVLRSDSLPEPIRYLRAKAKTRKKRAQP